MNDWQEYDQSKEDELEVGYYAVCNVGEGEDVWVARKEVSTSLLQACMYCFGWEPTHYFYVGLAPSE